MQPRSRALLLAAATVAALWSGVGARQVAWLGAPDRIAPGIELFKSSDQTLVDGAGPIAVYLLKLEAEKVRLDAGLSNGEVMDAERVADIAARYQAIAAVNAGFFNVRNGEPAGVLKVAGELVSDGGLARGVVAIRSRPGRKPELKFDQASVRMSVTIKAAGRDLVVPIDGVDTTRERGKLMLYTPSYHAHSDTAPNGVEWAISGKPLKVVEMRRDAGRTPIPRGGVVLSYGGLELPDDLAQLALGTQVTLATAWKTVLGTSTDDFEDADHVVNGAGLLKRDGKAVTNWREVENLNSLTFVDVRHPRTLVGLDRRGFIWLIAIDGRQPIHSVGMTFTDLVRLCDRLELTDALNLDGGGSTTMVVRGVVVNRPSDVTGPRAVSDALIVR